MSTIFGYIRVSKPELKIKEYDTYKAVYCTLCKVLGKRYGIFSRLTLSYDFTFLAMLNMAMSENKPEYKCGRCTFNPLKKCNYVCNTGELEMPSAAATVMVYYKLLDNIADAKGIKKLPFYIIKPIFSAADKKAAKKYPEIEKTVNEYINKQSALEREKCKSIDKAADPTSNALAHLFEMCSCDATQKRILNRLGYCMGRYIYLLDAVCDLEADTENGNYNVLKYDENGDLKRIKEQLYFCVNESKAAFELLDVKRYKTILGNIIYLGLEDTFLKEMQ